ncbi:unnamed protein product [Lactuca saligna]|uniref:Uncharacterized protein n=1 Tax=Lactuca saligna TaxID=75948 RepID=A0AA35ZZS7_LACSI|nr:unnamed protein product [Lactuca saligna]
MLLDLQRKVARVEGDLCWLVKECVVRIVDKVIECPKFMHGIGQIKDTCWVVGGMLVARGIKKEIVAGTFDVNDASSTSSHNEWMVNVIDSFASYDYTTLLHLGELDIDGLRRFCAFEDNDGEATDNLYVDINLKHR